MKKLFFCLILCFCFLGCNSIAYFVEFDRDNVVVHKSKEKIIDICNRDVTRLGDTIFICPNRAVCFSYTSGGNGIVITFFSLIKNRKMIALWVITDDFCEAPSLQCTTRIQYTLWQKIDKGSILTKKRFYDKIHKYSRFYQKHLLRKCCGWD